MTDGQMLFYGRFEYALDERGRLPLPPRFREALQEGAVLSQDFPHLCLLLYSREAFRQEAAQVTAVPRMHRRGRLLRWGLLSTSFDVELDKQSRVLIPPSLREYAGLSTKALVVGDGECLQIWSPESFADVWAGARAELQAAQESYEPRER